MKVRFRVYVCAYVRTQRPFVVNLQINEVLTGTLSGYFLLIFSPSAFLFSNGCSSLYWNFMLLSAYTICWLQLTMLALVICTYWQHFIRWRLRWNSRQSVTFSLYWDIVRSTANSICVIYWNSRKLWPKITPQYNYTFVVTLTCCVYNGVFFYETCNVFIHTYVSYHMMASCGDKRREDARLANGVVSCYIKFQLEIFTFHYEIIFNK